LENVTRAALPHFRGRHSGRIIQISSIGGRKGTAGLRAYQSAKFAVEGFSQILAREAGPLGIRVTIIEPGGFHTDWAGSSMTVAEVREEYKKTVGVAAGYIRGNERAQRGDPAG
jgi:NAD(P)-dependent dehydrogenase (short-subunit alcohol dehydrogenase family)